MDLSFSESLVSTVKKYGGRIPIDFLAKIHNRHTKEIEDYLIPLEQKGVIGREGDYVVLKSAASERYADRQHD